MPPEMKIDGKRNIAVEHMVIFANHRANLRLFSELYRDQMTDNECKAVDMGIRSDTKAYDDPDHWYIAKYLPPRGSDEKLTAKMQLREMHLMLVDQHLGRLKCGESEREEVHVWSLLQDLWFEMDPNGIDQQVEKDWRQKLRQFEQEFEEYWGQELKHFEGLVNEYLAG